MKPTIIWAFVLNIFHFYREDAETLARAQNNNIESVESKHEGGRLDKGMYSSLSLHHLYTLLDCLIQAHRFARNFNADSEQRTILWKSGFIGNAKPNLLKQETQSLSCCLRIMFRFNLNWSEMKYGSSCIFFIGYILTNQGQIAGVKLKTDWFLYVQRW